LPVDLSLLWYSAPLSVGFVPIRFILVNSRRISHLSIAIAGPRHILA
jgi:hypothetical protein